MKLPSSRLKSQDLENLLKESSIIEQHFFPRTVPSLPSFDSPSEETNSPLTKPVPSYENPVEKN